MSRKKSTFFHFFSLFYHSSKTGLEPTFSRGAYHTPPKETSRCWEPQALTTGDWPISHRESLGAMHDPQHRSVIPHGTTRLAKGGARIYRQARLSNKFLSIWWSFRRYHTIYWWAYCVGLIDRVEMCHIHPSLQAVIRHHISPHSIVEPCYYTWLAYTLYECYRAF